MTRVLALDLDGVINSAKWFAENDTEGRDPACMIDPACVARLNRLLDASGAHVVISSSWRIIHTVKEIDAALKSKGFTGTILGATPKYLGCRGNEIQAWITDNGHTAEDLVILDDDADMGHLAACLVRTAWSVGLTDQDVMLALMLFGVDLEDAELEALAGKAVG